MCQTNTLNSRSIKIDFWQYCDLKSPEIYGYRSNFLKMIQNPFEVNTTRRHVWCQELIMPVKSRCTASKQPGLQAAAAKLEMFSLDMGSWREIPVSESLYEWYRFDAEIVQGGFAQKREVEHRFWSSVVMGVWSRVLGGRAPGSTALN